MEAGPPERPSRLPRAWARRAYIPAMHLKISAYILIDFLLAILHTIGLIARNSATFSLVSDGMHTCTRGTGQTTDRLVRSSSVEDALGAAAMACSQNPRTYLGARYRGIAARRGPQKANVTIQHSMLIAIWQMGTDGCPYQDPGAD
jgi:hypothetical protein